MSASIVLWGTYDIGKPRVRNLISALKRLDPEITSSHFNLWTGVEDKSQMRANVLISVFARLIICYPWLIYQYCRLPSHKVVVTPYPSVLDSLVIWPLAKLRGAKLCCDLFLSLYDTVVVDRKIFKESSLFARLLYQVERQMLRLTDFVLTDTESHKAYLCRLYPIDPEKVHIVWVGAEDGFTKQPPHIRSSSPNVSTVLFYGQFIPLHGLANLIRAISHIEASGRKDILFHIVGRGQESAEIDNLIEAMGLESIHRTLWVDYAELPSLVASADVCLGIFPNEGKGCRVIPNKLFQIMAIGRPVVTGDTAGIREILQPGPGIRLTAAGDPEDIAKKILELVDSLTDANRRATEVQGAAALPCIGNEQLGQQLSTIFSDYLPSAAARSGNNRNDH